MNELVTDLLESRLEILETDINWTRSRLSDLALSAATAGNRMDALTAERRAIRDTLEASA